MAKSTLSFADRVRVHERLKEVVEAAGEGHCLYRLGCSDQSVADEFGCSANNVAYVRTEMFGKLRATQPARDAGMARLTETAAEHEAKLDALYQLAMRVAAEPGFRHLKEAVRLRSLFGDDTTVRG